ncbi:hypothetical protein ACTFIY_007651 [Dictyostelium cf. discoideum]
MKILYFIFIIIIILLISNHVKSKYNTFIFENKDGFPECNREVPIDKCTSFCGRLYGGLSYDGEDCYEMIHGEFLCSETERTSFKMDNYLDDDESWYRASFNYWVNCTWVEKNEPETPSPTENKPNTSTSSEEGDDYTFDNSEDINNIPTYSHSESYTDYNGNGNYDEDPQGNIGISLSSSLIFISILFLIIFINN